MQNLKAGVFLWGILCAAPVHAGPHVAGEGPVVVRGEVGKALEIIVANGVGDLVRSGDPSTLKVEHTSGHLFITPLNTAPAALTVIDARGKSFRIKFVFDQGLDEVITLADSKTDDAPQDGVMVFLRQMILGALPQEVVAASMDKVMFDDGRVRIRAHTVYERPQGRGYILDVENLTHDVLVVPLQRLAQPGLLAVAADVDVLQPSGHCTMYMVVRP